jgi:hypothetical protein
MDLFNCPFLQFMGGNGVRCFDWLRWDQEGESASRRRVVVGRGGFEVDSDEFEIRLDNRNISFGMFQRCAVGPPIFHLPAISGTAG